MGLSEHNRNTFLINLHKLIEEAAHNTATDILHARIKQLEYPPNGGLTEAEAIAVQKLQGDETLRDALRKLIASNSAGVLFNVLNILDGTGNPDPGTGDWSEVKLVDCAEDDEGDDEMLHDGFFETYWEWKKRRRSNWKLDIVDGD